MKLKHCITTAVLALACASSFANTLTDVYQSSDGQIFSLADAREVDLNCNNLPVISLITVSGSQTGGYADADGKTTAAIMASQSFGQFVRLGSTCHFYKPSHAVNFACVGGVTTLAWAQGAGEQVNDPGCAFYGAIRSGAQPQR